MDDFHFVLFKVFSRDRYNQGNNFLYPAGFDIVGYLNNLGFEQLSSNYFKFVVNDNVVIYAWLWSESIWATGGVDNISDWLYNVCRQFGGKNCDNFKSKSL